MKQYDIRNFGAQDGMLSTDAIQAAIDTCEKDGGGTIMIKNGTYISGTIFMKSNFSLLVGRKDNYIEDVSFNNCRFDVTEKAEAGFKPRFVRNLKTDCSWNIE